jgi:hypothetical protein
MVWPVSVRSESLANRLANPKSVMCTWLFRSTRMFAPPRAISSSNS